MEFSKSDVRLAEEADIPERMELVRLAIDGYPHLNEADYLEKLNDCIKENRALVLGDGNIMAGIMAFFCNPGSIEFMGVHPQYRNRGIQKLPKKMGVFQCPCFKAFIEDFI